MRIDRIEVENFKGFKERTLHFARPPGHPEGHNGSVHVLTGKNGAGKTATLDALAVAMGIWHVACKGYGDRNIGRSDVRMYPSTGRAIFMSAEKVLVTAHGEIDGKPVSWERSCQNLKKTVNLPVKGTTYGLDVAEALVRKTQDAKSQTVLPLLAYYGTNRWLAPKPRKKTSKAAPKQNKADLLRYAPYRGCLDPGSQARDLNQWCLDRDWTAFQTKKTDPGYELVRQAMLRYLPEATRLRFAPKMQEVTVEFENHIEQAFSHLSDGQRNMLAIVGDLAVKAVRLNHVALGDEVLTRTPGIVLIDVIDLHLHPIWQVVVVENLRTIFPNLQFIATTNSPYIEKTLQEGELINLVC